LRSSIVAANWKMNTEYSEARHLAHQLLRKLEATLRKHENVRVVLCPPVPWLTELRRILERAPIELGAQDVHPEKSGAFTGAVSAPMLKSAGARHVIVGHSERRRLFGEQDDIINLKVLAVLAQHMHPIICVGESRAQRQSQKTNQVVLGQVRAALKGAVEAAGGLDGFLRHIPAIAYEPVWAIGSGSPATPDDAAQVARLIRSTIELEVAPEAAENMPILYGGSIKPSNVEQFAARQDLDGVLVGGASLSPQDFTDIVVAYTGREGASDG